MFQDNFESDIPQLAELPTLDSILDEVSGCGLVPAALVIYLYVFLFQNDDTPPTIDELGLSDIISGGGNGQLPRASFTVDPNL